MKNSVFIIVFSLVFLLNSCNGLKRRENDSNCMTKLDVQLKDGSAMWIYNSSESDGYISGFNAMGEVVYIPWGSVEFATEVSCRN